MKRKVYVSLNLVCEVVSAIHHFIRVFSLSFVLIFFHFFLSFFLIFLLQNYSKNDISTWNFQLFCQSSLGKSICLGLVAELLVSFFWHIYIYIYININNVFENFKKEIQIFKNYKNIRFPVFTLSYRTNSKRRKRRKTYCTLLERQINKWDAFFMGLKLSLRWRF